MTRRMVDAQRRSACGDAMTLPATRCSLYARPATAASATVEMPVGPECVASNEVAAVRRYQASPSGKEAHCRRQRAYRTRRQTSRVTHHGPILIMNSDAKDVPSLCRCRICGLESNWINPWLPHPLALRRKPKGRPPWCRRGVQISTFLHDR